MLMKNSMTPSGIEPVNHSSTNINMFFILNDIDFNAPAFNKSFITHLHQVHGTLPFLQTALGGSDLVPLPPTPPPLFVFGRQLQREVGC
jgi:hypothetical protein